MRRTSALALFLVLILAACGGGGPGSDDGDGDGNGNGGDDATPTAAQETDGGDDGDDGDDDGNGSSGDLDELVDTLTPPNSTETSRTTAGGLIFVTFTSTDSPEDLQGFYESAIDDTGLDIFNTTAASGTFSWILGDGTDGGTGAVVSVAPAPDGNGSQVGIQVGTGE